jgi:hypothetical protein
MSFFFKIKIIFFLIFVFIPLTKYFYIFLYLSNKKTTL